MNIKFKHDGVWSSDYLIAEGSVITKNYNETLDSATICIPQQTTQLNIEPYDECCIDNTLYFCVDTFVETMVSVNPLIYNYEITLFSQTKLLEGIILPNITITPHKIGSKRTIYEYLTYYLNKYGTKIRKYGVESKKTDNKQATYTSRGTFSYSETIDADAYDIHIYFANTEIVPQNLQYSISGTTLTATFTAESSSELVDTWLIGQNENSWTPFSNRDTTKIGVTAENIMFYLSNGNSATTRDVTWDSATGTLSGEIYGTPTPSGFYATYQYNVNNCIVYAKYKSPNASKVYFTNKYSFANRVQSKFNVDCPEMQWNMPNLREVITDLMMLKDCIPTMSNGVIDYIDLTQTTGSVNTSNINYIQRSQSSGDYVSEAQMNMVNVVGKNPTFVSEYTPFNCDGYIASDNNIFIKTKHPILKVKHLWLTFFTMNGVSGTKNYDRVDLCNLLYNGNYYNFVKEYQEYITLPVKYKISTDLTDYTTEEYNKYQNFNLYFNRYGNEIKGFQTLTNEFFVSTTHTTLKILKYIASNNILANDGFNVYFNAFFQVEYETTADCMYSASKSEYPNNERVIVDNQTNSFVDSNTQGQLEYQKANRLGNPQLMLNQRVYALINAIQLGQVYDNDYIVYQTQYQIYNNHIEVNANTSKNYILKNYFTGIKSKIRTWINAKDEATKKNALIKYYCEFSYTSHIEQDIDIGIDARYLTNALDNDEPMPLKNCCMYTRDSNNVFYPKNALFFPRFYINELVGRVVGNSIVITFGFEDNWFYDKMPIRIIADSEKTIDENGLSVNDATNPHIVATLTALTDGGITMKPLKYCDNNGEYNKISMLFYEKYYTGVNEGRGRITNDECKAKMIDFYNLPIIKFENLASFSNYVAFSINLDDLKDNKEIPNYNIQFEFLCEDKDITFSNYFVENQRAIASVENYIANDYVIYVNDVATNYTLNYSYPDNNKKTTIFIGIVGNINNNDVVTIKRDNKVFLTFKKKNNLNGIYLNILKSRNKYIYNHNNEKVGTI